MIQFFNQRNHPRACCDRFNGNDARADGMRTNDHQRSIGMHWNWCCWFVMPMGRRLEPGTAGNRGRTKANRHSIQKTIQFIQMMGPREEPFPAAPSTPTTHPDPRSFNLHTNRMDCKRGRCLVDFIIRYQLPAHLGSAWDAVDLFGRPIFLIPPRFPPPFLFFGSDFHHLPSQEEGTDRA